MDLLFKSMIILKAVFYRYSKGWRNLSFCSFFNINFYIIPRISHLLLSEVAHIMHVILWIVLLTLFIYLFWMSAGRDMVLSVLPVGKDGVEAVEEEYHLIVTAYKKN